MKLDETTTAALLERHGIQCAKGEHRVPAGTDIAIDGWIDEAGHKMLRARSAAHAAERIVPIGDATADDLVDGLRAHHHREHDRAERSMLKHLFLRVSDLFEQESVEQFSLDPIRLHEHDYTVVSAAFFAPAAIHVSARLGRHARDHKTFRPTGEQ
jgi:hypothetical protein